MSENKLYQQIGRFIIMFQHVERVLTELLILIAKADDEFISILVNELEYSKRVKTADVMFARFVDLLGTPDDTAKKEFHKLMTECQKLGELRNDLVHSKYAPLVAGDVVVALIRENSKLRGGKGMREVEEEDLSTESFEPYFKRILAVQNKLEEFRLKIIDWQYPL